MKILHPLLPLLLGTVLATLPGRSLAYPPLQLYIQLTAPGGTLRLEPGIYSGPAVIDRPITIEGGGRATIDGGGSDSVISIRAGGVTLRGLRITHGGRSYDQADAGVLVEADDAVIEDNVIDDSLFGINLRNAADCILRSNRISSVDEEVGLRGEGIRLWYSSDNLIEDNTLSGIRDVLIINSPDNRISGNRISDGRVGLEFVFSPGNLIEDNLIEHNMTGIVGLYSDGLLIRNNRIRHLRDTAGAAFTVKESSQVRIVGNEILHCAVGLTANSPVNPVNILYLENNRFVYNDVAVYFYGDRGGHVITGNSFVGNVSTVAVSASSSALDNDWQGNYWDDYQGFDLDHDGIGDTPHSIFLYADRIWMDRPMSRFFRASPVLEMIDFMERLAPFSPPQMILQDPRPLVMPPPDLGLQPPQQAADDGRGRR